MAGIYEDGKFGGWTLHCFNDPPGADGIPRTYSMTYEFNGEIEEGMEFVELTPAQQFAVVWFPQIGLAEIDPVAAQRVKDAAGKPKSNTIVMPGDKNFKI